MPPKGKVQEKKVKKIVEDKTFGLKNKNKSKKVQQYINNVASTASAMGKSRKQLKAEEEAKKARLDAKKAAQAAKKEQAELFKTAIPETKVPPGVDPKSVLCEYFKAGKCQKGAKCKFSHDMQVGLKSAKIDLYSDPRELAKTDTIDKWDTDKLQEVVQRKSAGRMPPTDIVCKFFLDAIENGQYGWLWECENGATCHYRHALPPGFVLRKKEKPGERQDEDEDDKPSIEEEIEEERRKLDISKCTPLTLELFVKWKESKRKKKEEEVEKKRKEAAKGAAGGGLHVLSGRDLFRYDPTLFQDDEEADDERYVIESGDEADGKEEEDEPQPLYDRDAQGEVDVNVHDEDDAKDDGRPDSDEKKDRRDGKGDGDVNALSTAIDAELFLDEDVPDEDDEDDDEDEEEDEEDEKKS